MKVDMQNIRRSNPKAFTVRNRYALGRVKPEAAALEGKSFLFFTSYRLDEDDRGGIYAGEFAMVPVDPTYPDEAPVWIASGDLEALP